MDKRKSILIPTSGSYKDSASMIIYLLNILKGFDNINDESIKPHIILFHDNETPINDFKNLGYKYISFFNFKKNVPFLKRIINYIYRKYFNKHLLHTYKEKVDYVFPAMLDNSFVRTNKLIFWKADFQEKYLPHFFTKNDLEYSEKFFINLDRNKNSTLVLSSYDSLNSFKNFYPIHSNPSFILPFVSLLNYNNNNINEVKLKFNITKPYFIVCNQFWPHKNHIRVLEAINLIKNPPFQIVFTGNKNSYRNENIFDEIQKYIDTNCLNNDIIVTGFIDRDEQVTLIKNSIAVVQPSYFEGWSTVIEDAKALNKFVIASNINVNIEQIKEQCIFFNPDDANQLSNIIKEFDINHIDENRNYQTNIQNFSQKLIQLFCLNDK